MSYRQSKDRFSIFSAHEPQVREMAKKLQYGVDEILSAIQEVGFNEEEIEEYIRDRHDRA